MVDSLLNCLQQVRPFSVLVLGDFFLDTYTTGRVRRISPEGPVPILEVTREETRPGGAGNVALNLAVLGGRVIALGRMGEDRYGKTLQMLLRQGGIQTEEMIVQSGYKTPMKNRFIAGGQQLLRVDQENVEEIPPMITEMAKQQIDAQLPDIDVIAISDYGKGFLSLALLSYVIEVGKKGNIPVIVDPKGNDFTKYAGATLIKPNCLEAYGAARLPIGATLQEVAKQILHQTAVTWLLITRSEEGMTLFSQNGAALDFPVRSKEVRDVTGAGDTVLAMMCVGLGVGLELSSAVQLANIAAGIAVERIGCAQVTLTEVEERLVEMATTVDQL